VPPADARLRNAASAYSHRTGGEELSCLLVGFLIGFCHVHLALQENAGHGAWVVTLLPNAAVEVELAGHDRVGVPVLGDVVVVRAANSTAASLCTAAQMGGYGF